MRKIVSLLFIFIQTAAFSQVDRELISLSGIREAEQHAVVLRNGSGTIPLKNLKGLKIASLHFGSAHTAVFDSIANKYWAVESIHADTIRNIEEFNKLHDQLKLHNLIVFDLSAETRFSKELLAFISDVESKTKSIIILSGSGKNLELLAKFKSAIIWNKHESASAASFSAQLMFGGASAANKLNADYGYHFKKGYGYTIQKIRLGYSLPDAVSLNGSLAGGIDSIVNAGIAAHSAPAVVILVAKDGKVIFSKAYGSHTYKGTASTKADDIFDMASVTKVSATTPAIMRLYDKKLISLEDTISRYVALTRNIPDKRDIKIKEALLHEAGYTPYIKFFELLKPGEMSNDSSSTHPTKVADNYFLRANYFNEVMWPVTLASTGGTRGKFVYSDVSMYMLKEVVEQVSHSRLNDYVSNEFYTPLGMLSTGYQPRNRFEKSRIVPTTENDNWFRDMLVQGYVNDPGAAMSGGVQGHAGLFSNANDLAIYFQMLLNNGMYGGQKYFEAGTVKLFTSHQSKVSERGYGFARVTQKELNANKGYPSEKAFGHSGYTGTYVWVDPVYNLVYICLTNRVYPDDGKTFGVSKVNIRAQVLDRVYQEILRSDRDVQK
ncbi:CubicO group peptidase, beta-lactamase class C family [Daejeonella rubra]|uniref:CubicO group peptidase, beta-lactamase class C family n=1 Tax=Daejeonella rubra TaxID=990371 RepID=A0A1G9RS07_9SPHI|nr:serine hydrolase [Daejeonella rubra]SDM26011.1 CubicO group peptidase, beta-lactamase class C family [Daejeonella rubra]